MVDIKAPAPRDLVGEGTTKKGTRDGCDAIGSSYESCEQGALFRLGCIGDYDECACYNT